MPRKRQPRLVTETPTLSYDAIASLHQRFGFRDGYTIELLRCELETAVTIYWSYVPSATAKQQAKELRRIHRLTDQLVDALGRNGVAFLDVEPIGIRRPLFELRDKAAQHAHRCQHMPPEHGQKPKHGLDGFICCLQQTYYGGTGCTELYTRTTSKSGRERGLLQFASAVADLYGIDVADDSITNAIKRLEQAGELEKWLMGRKRT